jgi:hypothetical protein
MSYQEVAEESSASQLALGRTLIQILPRFRPLQCGVSDHALALAQELKRSFGVSSVFVALGPVGEHSGEFEVIQSDFSGLQDALASAHTLNHSPLLLHYSGYGYSPDGAPSDLATALKTLKSSRSGKVGVYFHEIYASGKPWQSAFWHSSKQKKVARELGNEADFIATNMATHAAWLGREVLSGRNIPFRQLPVFSSVGESQNIQPASQRNADLIILGLPETRRRSYEWLAGARAYLKDLGVKRLLDVGPEFQPPSLMHDIPVERLGVLSSSALAELLSNSQFGFVPHPPFCFAKSSVFSSFCAMGTIPVSAKSFSEDFDGLKDGIHVISPATLNAVMVNGFDAVAKAGKDWYSSHSLAVHASTYAECLLGLS